MSKNYLSHGSKSSIKPKAHLCDRILYYIILLYYILGLHKIHFDISKIGKIFSTIYNLGCGFPTNNACITLTLQIVTSMFQTSRTTSSDLWCFHSADIHYASMLKISNSVGPNYPNPVCKYLFKSHRHTYACVTRVRQAYVCLCDSS